MAWSNRFRLDKAKSVDLKSPCHSEDSISGPNIASALVCRASVTPHVFLGHAGMGEQSNRPEFIGRQRRHLVNRREFIQIETQNFHNASWSLDISIFETEDDCNGYTSAGCCLLLLCKEGEVEVEVSSPKAYLATAFLICLGEWEDTGRIRDTKSRKLKWATGPFR